MAKDDYNIIVYKILAYLYAQLKAGADIDAAIISANGPLFCIHARYWAYVLENLQAQGHIRGLVITKPWGSDTIVQGLSDCEITPDGIAYLCENSLMEKTKQFLKDIKEITPLI
ncbi:MAG: YjcQ family protein [Ruthenibacterium sp.]